jgi:hypothetical protein
VDADIEQLLKSLNIEETSIKTFSTESSSPPIAPTFHHQSFVQPKRRLNRSVLASLSVCIFVGLGFFLFFMRGKFWADRPRIVHVHEAAVSPNMAGPITPAVQRIDPWSLNALSSNILPSGASSENPALAAHLDLLKAAGERKKALEEIRRDIDMLMANCIHAPDMVNREAFHRAVARFDMADLNLTHSLIPLILSKRSFLATPQDQQKFNETLSFVGLGAGLEEYAKAVAHIAAAKELIEQFFVKLRNEKDLCSLAETVEGVHTLFTGLRKDPLISSFIDLDATQKEAFEISQRSVQELLEKFPASDSPRRCSLVERKAVSFFQEIFPSIDSSLFAKVDGFLILPDKGGRLTASLENHLGLDAFSYATTRVFMTPESILTDETEY